MRWKSDDVRIVDFGIAKLLEEDAQHLTQTGEAIGTPFYMSPEQCNGLQGQDPATDIYAIACVMHECLSGQPPFRGTSAVDTFTSIYKELPKPLTSTQNGQRVAPLLEASILKGLEKDPKRRHLTAAAFQRSIIEALDKGKEKEALQYLVGRAQTRMNRLRQRVGENQLKLAAATIAFTIGAALLIAYKPEIRDALHKALSPTLHSIYIYIYICEILSRKILSRSGSGGSGLSENRRYTHQEPRFIAESLPALRPTKQVE